MSERKELREALDSYTTETLSCIKSVRGFCEKIPEWVNMRETEQKMMTYIKNQADKVQHSQDEVKAFQEYMKSRVTPMDSNSSPTDPGEQLAVVLKDTLRGLEELHCFLDAVEKLAVTSHHVFMENQMLHLPGIKFEHIQIVIAAARMICPLLLKFKRDAQVFFLPKLQNVEVLSNQLDVYIETTQKIYQELGKSSFGDFCLKMNVETRVDLDDVSKDDIPRMFNHISQLDEIRKELREALESYTTETFSCIKSVRSFCEKIPEWVNMRETEQKMMTYIKNKADKVKQSRDEVKAFQEYMKSRVTPMNPNSRRADPSEQLAVVLKDTLRGLEELHCFLDAVEKLAVTSPHVFMENQVLHLPGIRSEHVQIIIVVTRLICPLLLNFKRDAKVFFLPKLQNVEVLSNQLEVYIETTQKICQELGKSFFGDFCLKTNVETQIDLVSEDDIQRMFFHINLLDEIRMNQHFRTVFLFQGESCSKFISEFKERQPRMLQFLKELEECAVKLYRMNKGSKISSVAGSSVGAVGSVLSIVGLALIPVTAGVSLGLTITGAGMGVASGVNSAVTTATELGVNATQEKKANDVFKVFMADVQALQDCLEEVINETEIDLDKITMMMHEGMVLGNTGGGGFLSLALKASNVGLLDEAAEDIGQAAAQGSLALSKSARAGLIAANALFLGMDIFFICKDSVSLAKGSETKVSQFIRARSALWSSEIDSWQKIHDSLSEGLLTSKRKKAFLETPFYPEIRKRRLSIHEPPPF